MSRSLDYCGVRSICGKEVADEIFARHLPLGFDIDQPGDELMVETIVREHSRCDSCPDLDRCDPPHS